MGLRDKIADEQAEAYMEEIEKRFEQSEIPELSETAYEILYGQFKVHLTIGIKKWAQAKNASDERSGIHPAKPKSDR